MSNDTAVKLSKGQTFVRRLCSSLFLYGVLMAGLFAPNEKIKLVAFGGIMVLLGAVALVEYFQMARKRELAPFVTLGTATGVGLIGLVFWAVAIRGDAVLAGKVEIAFLICLIPALGICQLCTANNERGMAAIASTLFGVFYVAILLNVLQKIRYFPDLDGAWWLLYFIVVSKMSDTGAYCTGSLIGKNKMIPRVSPGKTWEGFVGGIVFSVVSSWAFLHFAGGHFSGFTLVQALVLGALLGVGSVVGDLVESLMKREVGLKDSGEFFPGVGGVLDLLDSLLFNAPLMYLFLKYGLAQ
jgi:phosphatidate cytidylyltransferase